jgi:calcineurin-like phosphoesterase family protein
MNKALIENHNSVVGKNDTVFHLGDFCFGDVNLGEEFREQLNGNIVLIKGNHDKIQNNQIKHLFNGVYDYLKIKVKDDEAEGGWQKIILCHYAFRVWDGSHRKSWNFFAHSHGTLPDDPNALAIDVGVDCHNYTPISYQQVKNIMAKKNFIPVDHHGNTNVEENTNPDISDS